MEIGQMIGRFRVSKQIGKGGMGNVYLALDTVNFRQVAVKVLPRIFQANRMLIARFLREMEVARRLSHPNIVSFLEAGLDRDQFYLAQEYIQGSSLEDLINRSGTLPLALSLSIMQDASFALSAVHQQQIIHRDIKPQNIMVTKDQVIKLIDFGISMARDERVQHDIQGELDRIGLRYRPSDLRTQPGVVIGTPCYNSPEQNSAREVSFTADIYSLGLVFYEMFTGSPVLHNATLGKIIEFQEKLDDTLVPVSKINPEIPPGVDEIIAKMIRFRPEDRFQTATELVLALKRLNLVIGGHEMVQEGAGGGQGKRIAQLELFETYYWKAMNHFGDHKYLEALGEYEALLALNVTEGQYREKVEENVNFLFWVLRASPARQFTGRSKARAFRVTHEDYLESLMKLMSIYHRLGMDAHKRLVEKRFVKAVSQIDEYERALELYDRVFALYPGDLPPKAGYAAVLYANGAISAGRCAQIDIVKQHYNEKNFEMAYVALEVILQHEDGNAQVREEVDQLAGFLERRKAEKTAFLEKVAQMKGSRDPEFFRLAYEKFLEKYPDDLDVMDQLLDITIDMNLEERTATTLTRLGELLYDRNEPEAAKDRFVKALLIDAKCTIAMSYLVEIFRDEGVTFSDCESYRDAMIKLFTMIGFYKEGIAEYERKLRGSLADIDVYEKMIGLYRKTGHTSRVHEIYFQMGRCALTNSRPDLARDYFDEALERAKDKDRMYDQLRQVPNINKVYDLMKLVYARRQSHPEPVPDGREQLSTLIQKIRGPRR